MSVQINVSRVDKTLQGSFVEGTFGFTGNYPAGGETINWGSGAGIPSNSGPLGLVDVKEQPAFGTAVTGYLFYLIAGSSAANWKLQVATAGGQPSTQVTAGAYPAALLTAVIQFRAFFRSGV